MKQKPCRNSAGWHGYPLDCSACFLLHPRTNRGGVSLPTVGCARPHQSSIKKVHHRFAYKTVWWRHFFFNELPLFQMTLDCAKWTMTMPVTLLYVLGNVWHGRVPLSWELANFQQLNKIPQPCKVTAKASVPRHWGCLFIFINNQKGSTGPVSRFFFFFSLVCDRLPIPHPRVSTKIVDEYVCPLYSLVLLLFCLCLFCDQG